MLRRFFPLILFVFRVNVRLRRGATKFPTSVQQQIIQSSSLDPRQGGLYLHRWSIIGYADIMGEGGCLRINSYTVQL